MRACPPVWVIATAVCLALLFGSARASAYPWMIRHGYAGCAVCHTDPSGGAGALTEYGRGQGDVLLRMHYGSGEEVSEPHPSNGFLWGLAPLPAQLRLGGDFREGFFRSVMVGAPVQQKLITMRADLYGDVKLGRFRATANVGYAPLGDLPVALTSRASDNVISREHWVGGELDEDGAWLLRAGKLALPFGIRMIEHTLWARALTRTDLDATQSYGLALAFARGDLRGEVMGIAGNFEVHPDDFRERGYSAYAEYAPLPTLAFGASSLFTRATRDLVYGVTDYRYANGLFARYSPVRPLALLAEADSIYQSLTWNGHRSGFAAFVQADYEPAQGFHAMVTAESMNGGTAGEPTSWSGWLSLVWFFLPHADLRFDGIHSAVGAPASATVPASSTEVTTWLIQLHAYL